MHNLDTQSTHDHARRPVRGHLLKRAAVALAALCVLAFASPASAFDIYLNGKKATGLINADLKRCDVRFDAQGNLHILSPGYNLVLDKDGKPLRVTGSPDLAGVAPAQAQPKASYVLVYQPNPKVPYTFEISINNKPFRSIGLQTGPFTIGLGTAFNAGPNALKVTGKPAGSPPPGGTESDVAKLIIYSGHELPDGSFKAKHPPVWQLVRAAIDQGPVERTSTIIAE